VKQRVKERRLEQVNFIKERKASRMMLRDVLMSRSETCEIGEKYIKTERGIVTFPVLMKRTKATDLKTLAIMLEMLNAEDFDREMTPNPKSKIDRLKSELNSVLDRGWGAIEGNPHLFQRAHVLQSQIAAEEAKLDAKLGGGLGSLVGTNPVTKDAWMAVVEEKAKKRNSRGLMDPQRWEEEGE
jgi:hypothetical protein